MKKEREVSGRTKSITQVGDGMKASGNRNYSKLGKQIKKKLIDNNMTAAQLADALGTTPQYLNKNSSWRSKRREVHLRRLEKY